MGGEQTRRPLRVLIVEDSETDAALLLRQLAVDGYDVTSVRVETAQAFKQALAEHAWDLVISDYSLPAFDAPKALAVLKQSGLDLPFIVVSGTIGEETAVDALRSGAHDFLSKGKLARLLPAIEREMREAEVRTAKREAERALRESEHRYRRILETTNEGVWELDASGAIRFSNRRMAILLGHDVAQMLGRSPFEYVHDESRAQLEQRLADRTAAPAGHVEIRFRTGAGAELSMLLESTPIFDRLGDYEGALLMAIDVTARKRLEDQLLQAQKLEAVGRLAGGVAHDFNNLLSVIISYTTLCMDAIERDGELWADLDEVKKAGERAADLTHQLLAFSRRQVLEPRTLDLNLVLQGMQKMLRRLLPEHIELAFAADRGLGQVLADPGQMEQVIMNLVLNAKDAMLHGGRITIETVNAELDQAYASSHLGVRPGHYVQLAVTDTGIGMEKAARDRVFEPFFTTKEKGKGTGLGLATVFGIVQQSGGHIWVDSEPDQGASFKIYLPRHDAAPESIASSVPPPPEQSGNETILLVEDEDAVRAVTRMILARQGYHVLEAQNGGEAFLVSEKYGAEIQLLITDVVMPRVGGREVAQRLTEARPALKVLYISGYTEDMVTEQDVKAAGNAFLQKPVRPDELLDKVRKILDAPAVLRLRRA